MTGARSDLNAMTGRRTRSPPDSVDSGSPPSGPPMAIAPWLATGVPSYLSLVYRHPKFPFFESSARRAKLITTRTGDLPVCHVSLVSTFTTPRCSLIVMYPHDREERPTPELSMAWIVTGSPMTRDMGRIPPHWCADKLSEFRLVDIQQSI